MVAAADFPGNDRQGERLLTVPARSPAAWECHADTALTAHLASGGTPDHESRLRATRFPSLRPSPKRGRLWNKVSLRDSFTVICAIVLPLGTLQQPKNIGLPAVLTSPTFAQ